MTSRELVRAALRFESPKRLPRQLWALPWAAQHYPQELEQLNREWPGDFSGPANVYRPSKRKQGDPYRAGVAVDEWGCTFTGVMDGVIGEVRDPLLPELADWPKLEPPYEILPEDETAARAAVNRSCAESDKFMMAGCCPRPWERYQFIRGTEEALIDMADPDEEVMGLLRKIHEFHLAELAFWAKTEVDALMFMDDWGSQWQLLINPQTWRQVFKPLYKDYIDIAHAHGKFAFMHSDGCIIDIYPDLVELGLDAINSQLFTMNLDKLAQIGRGKITFWGEIDRQHALRDETGENARACVRQVYEKLYLPEGGIIAQFEASPGSHPKGWFAVFDEWQKLTTPERASVYR